MPHTWPSTVRIRGKLGYRHCNGGYHCGYAVGVILSKNWVLTSGDECRRRHPAQLSVAVGAHYDSSCDYSGICDAYKGIYRTNTPYLTGATVNVSQIVLHPNYTTHDRASDKYAVWNMCLLEVDDMPIDNQIVTAATLPLIHIGDVHTMNPKCFAVGWGATKGSPPKRPFPDTRNLKHSPVVLSTEIILIKNGSCTNRSGDNLGFPYRYIVDFSHNFCAGMIPGHDTCLGDGGSPLICTIGDSQVVYGIFSTGPKVCGNYRGNLPGIYTTVARGISWIQQYVPGKHNIYK